MTVVELRKCSRKIVVDILKLQIYIGARLRTSFPLVASYQFQSERICEMTRPFEKFCWCALAAFNCATLPRS